MTQQIFKSHLSDLSENHFNNQVTYTLLLRSSFTSSIFYMYYNARYRLKYTQNSIKSDRPDD